MKKLLSLLFILSLSFSINAQQIIKERGGYDSYNKAYIQVTVYNDTFNPITCLVFKVIYDTSMWDTSGIQYVPIRIKIPPKSTKSFKYYPPQTGYRPYRQFLVRAIYIDGSYKNMNRSCLPSRRR